MFTYNTATKTLTHGKVEGVHFHTAEEACDLLTGGQLQDLVEAATGKRPGRFRAKDKAIPQVEAVLKALPQTTKAAEKDAGVTTNRWFRPVTATHKKRGMAKAVFDLVFAHPGMPTTEVASKSGAKHSYVLLCLRDGVKQGLVEEVA